MYYGQLENREWRPVIIEQMRECESRVLNNVNVQKRMRPFRFQLNEAAISSLPLTFKPFKKTFSRFKITSLFPSKSGRQVFFLVYVDRQGTKTRTTKRVKICFLLCSSSSSLSDSLSPSSSWSLSSSLSSSLSPDCFPYTSSFSSSSATGLFRLSLRLVSFGRQSEQNHSPSGIY